MRRYEQNPTYVVTRQVGYEEYTVEVAEGGWDNVGPSMLVTSYEGEGEKYHDPREAVSVAITILTSWKRDKPNEDITLAYGNTLGGLCHLDPGGTPEETTAWAERCYTNLTKCTRCGEIIEGAGWFINELGFDEDELFCTEHCTDYALHEFWASVDDFVTEDMAELEKEVEA